MIRLTFALLYAATLLLAPIPTVMGARSLHEIQLRNRLNHITREFGEVRPPANGGYGVTIDTTIKVKETADDVDNLIRGPRIANLNTPDKEFVPPVLHNGTVLLPINHFGRSPAPYIFRNRFWVVDEYYKPGGPVFTFDTGEAEDGYLYSGYLTNNASFFNQYLREFGGIGILWEHRYYGESTPYPINSDTTSKQMQWLTTEQALKDFAVFANRFTWKVGGPKARYNKTSGSCVGRTIDFNPKKTPWIHIGGSYPGMRAGLLRDRYPETIFAAYASSAPIQASINMTAYWDQVYRGMVKYGYENCTHNIKSAFTYIDSQLDRPDTAAAIKQLFLGRTAEKNSNGAFADVLLYPLSNWQSYGADPIMQEFCTVLENGNDNVQVDSRKKTGKVLADRWAKWRGFVELINEYNPDIYCEGFVQNNSMKPDCRIDEPFTGILGISWTWQYCTEWGYFQATNQGPNALGSKYNTLKHQQEICYRQFPDGLPSGYLPKRPRDSETNLKFGGWKKRPTNVFWTGGEFDPWRTLSPLSNEAFSWKFQTTTTIPKCNEKKSTKEPLFAYLMKNAEHCYDFDSLEVTPQAEVPQRLFAQALKEWLKCFRPREGLLNLPW